MLPETMPRRILVDRDCVTKVSGVSHTGRPTINSAIFSRFFAVWFVSCNQPRVSVPRHVVPRPLSQHEQPILVAHQRHEVDKQPRQPRERS